MGRKVSHSGWERNLLEKIDQHIRLRRYRLSRHAMERLRARSLELHDLVSILRRGFHEESKSVFNIKMQTWNYAIRGKTLDGVDARVVIAFEKDMIIITAIRLTNRKK